MRAVRAVVLLALLRGQSAQKPSTLEDGARCVLRAYRGARKYGDPDHSQNGEDFLLLPTLLRATAGRPATFVELGALNGISL